MKIEELRIPAPWGHIAAKSWGTSDDYVILAHGYGDNAGSFDGLIPLLPSCYKYIAIDLPGHGLSSKFPEGHPVHAFDFLLAIKITCDFFNRSKYILIGYSMGGCCFILYTMMYPERVEKLVSLDMMMQGFLGPTIFAETLRSSFKLLKKDVKQIVTRTGFTYDQYVRTIINYRNLSKNAADAIAKRMERRNEDGTFYIEFDKRMRALNSFDGLRELAFELYEKLPIRCPFLIILTEEFHMHIAYLDLYRFLRTKKNVVLHIVKGNHDVPLNFPERISNYVSTFLIQSQHKL